jgi:ABC-type multidrug transport system permease subunit
MTVRPAGLNTAIASLFIIGSALFVLGSVPAYVNAVGATADSVTYFAGSLFFTAASFAQLLQAQTPAMTAVDIDTQHQRAPVRLRAWLPHDRNWLAAITQFPGTVFFNISTVAALAHNATVQEQDRRIWRPDFYGSTLFLVASVFAILALGRFFSFRPRSVPWWIAWLNMIGSILFMASALASFVLPRTGEVINSQISIAGTLLGALCFLIGAILMFPAWKHAVRGSASSRDSQRQRAALDQLADPTRLEGENQ